VVKPTGNREVFHREMGVLTGERVLALAPGSRLQEVSSLLPLFLSTYARLRRDFPELKAWVACSPTIDQTLYRRSAAAAGLDENFVRLLEGRTYDLLGSCDAALVASGTVTLETAILGTPMVMAYKVSPLTFWIAKRVVKIPNIALVNVVAGKAVVPEFIQGDATPEKIAAELAILLRDPARVQAMKLELNEVKSRLGEPGASLKTATILREMIKTTPRHVPKS
jgi:lipid-A-disaccharide synthase